MDDYKFELVSQNYQSNGHNQFAKPIHKNKTDIFKNLDDKPTKNGMKIGAYVQKTFQGFIC